MKKAVCPGTFDPITNGHLDIIRRGLEIFDEVIVAVAKNPKKMPLFGLEERLELIRGSVKGLQNVRVDAFDGLLVDYVRSNNGIAIIRGLRAISDFEYEFQMALMNRKLDDSIETVFLMPSEEYSFLSSRILKEVASLNGDVSGMVPKAVVEGLRKKFKK